MKKYFGMNQIAHSLLGAAIFIAGMATAIVGITVTQNVKMIVIGAIIAAVGGAILKNEN